MITKSVCGGFLLFIFFAFFAAVTRCLLLFFQLFVHTLLTKLNYLKIKSKLKIIRICRVTYMHQLEIFILNHAQEKISKEIVAKMDKNEGNSCKRWVINVGNGCKRWKITKVIVAKGGQVRWKLLQKVEGTKEIDAKGGQ